MTAESKFALGTPVATSREAYVVRRFLSKDDNKWFIPVKGNFATRTLYPHGEGLVVVDVVGPITNIPVEFLSEISDRTNKAVVAIRNSRSGIVIGLERKMIGHSIPGGGHGEDYDQGYLEAIGFVDLYVVKSELRGTPFYVPMDSITVLT